MTKKILVIGAGASGLIAAGQAAAMGAQVLLLEKMEKPGKKISISGKGRCNITNIAGIEDFLSHFNRDGRFLRQAFSRFFTPQLIDLFNDLGLKLVTERGGRVFPASGKATDVVHTLLAWIKKNGVQIQCSSPVTDLLLKEGTARGVICKSQEIYGDAVIVSTGGASYPATGSTGDGYRLAATATHSVTPIIPALIPLTHGSEIFKQLAGLDLRNVGVRIFINGKRKINDFGEVGFSHVAIGGPLILIHSKFVVKQLQQKKSVTISFDLKPALDEKKLDARLQRDFTNRHNETIASVLRGLLPQALIPVCLSLLVIEANKLAGEINAKERKTMGSWLKDFRIPITGHRPLKEAIVTAGGIKVKEINPNTMESLLVNNLYFCGEVIDVDADTGGYNLQAAFSTGWLAGQSAAQKIR